MPINETYRTWIQRICILRPKQRITQVQNFVWLVVGIYHSHSVHLSKIAGKVIGEAKNESTVRRLSRFLANGAIDVRRWYKPIAKEWLSSQFKRVGEIRLIVDGTKVGFGHQLLMVSLAYRHRAVPIAWSWIKYVRGHSTAKQQLSLLHYVGTLLPPPAPHFSGRRQRIWLDCCSPSVRCLALVLCFAAKAQPGSLAQRTDGLEKARQFGSASRTKCLVPKSVSDPAGDLSRVRLDLLGNWREGSLVSRHQPSRSDLDGALLSPPNVDRRNVRRFQKTWLRSRDHHVASCATLISFDLGRCVSICVAPFPWQSHDPGWLAASRRSQRSS
jgi:hypothetical protein